MNSISVQEKNFSLDSMLNAASGSPVTLMRNGEPVAVVTSIEHSEKRRLRLAQEFLASMEALGAEAVENGMTDELLRDLLSDES